MTEKQQLLESTKKVLEISNYDTALIKEYLQYLNIYLDIRTYKDIYKIKINNKPLKISTTMTISALKKRKEHLLLDDYVILIKYYNPDYDNDNNGYIVLDIISLNLDKSIDENKAYILKKIKEKLKEKK